MKENTNALLIIYILYDFYQFIYELRDTALKKGEDATYLTEHMGSIELFIDLYLKGTISKEEYQMFLHDMKDSLLANRA